jgi:hypothetical protein
VELRLTVLVVSADDGSVVTFTRNLSAGFVPRSGDHINLDDADHLVEVQSVKWSRDLDFAEVLMTWRESEKVGSIQATRERLLDAGWTALPS